MEHLNDILGYKNLKIYQNDNFFSFSIDSIILANYATLRFRDKMIIDFCTGNGIVPIILSRRTSNDIIGVEIQKKLCDLAIKSVKYNCLDDRITIINSDIKEFCKDKMDLFDLVLCNPPYFKNEKFSSKNFSYEKMIARHEIMINLNDICFCAKKILKDNGNLCLVHRCDRLIDVINSFQLNSIEPKRVKFIYNNIDSSPILFLIEGQKNGKSGLIIDKPLILYDQNGNITAEYKKLQEVICK